MSGGRLNPRQNTQTELHRSGYSPKTTLPGTSRRFIRTGKNSSKPPGSPTCGCTICATPTRVSLRKLRAVPAYYRTVSWPYPGYNDLALHHLLDDPLRVATERVGRILAAAGRRRNRGTHGRQASTPRPCGSGRLSWRINGYYSAKQSASLVRKACGQEHRKAKSRHVTVSTRMPIAPSDWQPRTIRYREALNRDGVLYRYEDGLGLYHPDRLMIARTRGVLSISTMWSCAALTCRPRPRRNPGGRPRTFDWEGRTMPYGLRFYSQDNGGRPAKPTQVLADQFAEHIPMVRLSTPKSANVRKR